MKYLIALTLFLNLGNIAFAKSCTEEVGEAQVKKQLEISTDVPAHLRGATITIRLADGRESSVPAEKFKVVARKQQFIVTELERSKVTSCVKNRSHRVSGLIGHGAQAGLKTSANGNMVEVESKTGIVGGGQYQYMLNDRLSIGGQYQTNETGSFLLGIDF